MLGGDGWWLRSRSCEIDEVVGLVSARFTDVVVISLSIWSCVVVMGGGSTWTLEGSFTPVWLGDDHDGLREMLLVVTFFQMRLKW